MLIVVSVAYIGVRRILIEYRIYLAESWPEWEGFGREILWICDCIQVITSKYREADMDDKKYIDNISSPSFAGNGTRGTHIAVPRVD